MSAPPSCRGVETRAPRVSMPTPCASTSRLPGARRIWRSVDRGADLVATAGRRRRCAASRSVVRPGRSGAQAEVPTHAPRRHQPRHRQTYSSIRSPRTRIVMAGRAGHLAQRRLRGDLVPGRPRAGHDVPRPAERGPGRRAVRWSCRPPTGASSARTTAAARWCRALDAPMEMGTSAWVADWTGPGSAPLYVGGGFGTPRSNCSSTSPVPRFTALGFGPAANSRGVLAVAACDISGQRVVVAIAAGARGPGGAWVTDRGPARRRPPLRAGRTGRP